MYRIISHNLNGIRSASTKGWLDWVAAQQANVICVQELKAQLPDLTAEMQSIGGLRGYFHCATKKGYSGVGIYTDRQPVSVIEGLGVAEFDEEGRYLELDLGDLIVISVYLPSGSSSPERQAAKFRFLEIFLPHLQQLIAKNREIVICGDWNIAHHNIDLKNWKGNQKNSGFLPEERAWLTQVLELGWVDVFRTLYPTQEIYTWWSNRGQAFAKDVGWRIDYQIATPAIAKQAVDAIVTRTPRFSDHAPLLVEYHLKQLNR